VRVELVDEGVVMRSRCAAVVLATALIVTGCSSGDGGDDEAATTTTTEATVPMTPLPTSFPAPDGAPCTAADGAPMVVTPDCVDPEVAGEPYVDVDEERTTTHPETDVTVRYRYVRGGFRDSDVRFAFAFPAPDTYEGRFFQSTYPTVSEEDPSDDTIVFAISNGAYVVSSNNAGGVAADPVLGGYRANAAAAKFSRVVAAELYGADAPTRGYVYGASGGAYQTVGALENTSGVWQGGVPMVPGVPNSIPSFMSVQVLALRLLADDWPDIVDALEPGGTGDPYATLDEDEQAVLREVTSMGHPLGGWWQWETLRGGAFSFVASAVLALDASYVDDFFTQPGYEGTDPEVAAARVQHETTIAEVEGSSLTLAAAPTGWLDFVDLVVTSGEAAGETISLVEVDGTGVTLPDEVDPEVAAALAAGDAVRVDNSFYLALSYYHRHQVPAADQYGWDQFRGPDGAPVPPQRPLLVGQVLAQVFGGLATGEFEGKMIMLSSLLDVQAFPWAADWYRTQARAALGDQLDDRYRLWYLERTDHQPPSESRGYAHIVEYDAALQQALLDLDAWVLDGTPPPASSAYEVTEENQVEVPADPGERRGIQPVVSLAVAAGDGCDAEAGSVRADAGAGEPVSFSLTAEVPPGGGEIVRVEWDPEGTGEYPEVEQPEEVAERVALCRTHTYDEPGTYFAVARVTSHRDGDVDAVDRLVQNLARVRVVVS